MKIKLALSALAAAFVLGACGGGGGDATEQAGETAAPAAEAVTEAPAEAAPAEAAPAEAAPVEEAPAEPAPAP